MANFHPIFWTSNFKLFFMANSTIRWNINPSKIWRWVLASEYWFRRCKRVKAMFSA